MKLYLTRHGQTEWNVEKRMQGAMDSPLTELGRRQARRLRLRLAALPIDRMYVSPLPRARATAQLLAEERQLATVVDGRLREAALGAFEGLTMEQAQQRYPEQAHAFRMAPERFEPVGGGERFEQVHERVSDFLAEIQEMRGTVLVVAHALVLRVFRLELTGLPLSQLMGVSTPGGCFCQAEWSEGRWRLKCYGECWHQGRDFGEGLWYYGSPERMTALRPGAVITPNIQLARALACAPRVLSVSDDGRIAHDGRRVGHLYRVAGVHPQELSARFSSGLSDGQEWITQRSYRLVPV